ncbi:MAG TPA: alpha/beta hydrolase, partial [Caulobacter sp.]|nr:alpha/beta hydrolase [Caulobacter sp.]
RPAVADGAPIPLWPEGTDLAKPDTGDGPEVTGKGSSPVGGRDWHWVGDVSQPTMTLYHPRGRNTGTTMLVLPGGGFSIVAMDLEGSEICDWAVRQGMTCVVLKYRAPQKWPWDERRKHGRRPEVLLALQDAQRAMGLLRERAGIYGINPDRIGVIGFSAGAYLAADVSNIEGRTYPPVDAADRRPSRPAFAIMAYTGRLWAGGSSSDLGLAPWVKISPRAPPTLLIHAMDDPVDDIRHPMAYALALHEAGAPVDVRFYAKGGHAYGMRPTADPVTTQWPGQAEQWLRDLGLL